MTQEAAAAEVLGQLLAMQSALKFLKEPRQAGEFVAHALQIVPGVRATAAWVDGEEIRDGHWGRAWETAQRGCLDVRGLHRWHDGGEEGQVLIVAVETLRHRYGCLGALVDSSAQIAPYVPFMDNLASSLALELDSRRQRAELEAAYQKLSHSQRGYELLFGKMNSGFAVHEIITDDSGRAVDYRFLEANQAFEALTGLA
ncbi:MAG TPA: hypothetical protein VJ787_07650, partial [Thermoleophilia bacterium]|nr:hypothetical protein [Thermoleophilia bacterium]